MPRSSYDAAKAQEIWSRYAYLRDNGHLEYIEKAKRCEDFFAGLQWTSEDLARLKASRRPALTINKILSTISSVLGEQIFNRTEIAFRPKRGAASSEVADVLTKVFSHIGDQNQLEWVRSDVFADGLITSRGYYDTRLDFTDSLRGEVSITQLNPKNVLPDADADEYDPDKWGDVLTTRWMSPDQIGMLYGKEYAKEFKGRGSVIESPYGFDNTDLERDRFAHPRAIGYNQNYASETASVERSIRVLERQYRTLDTVRHFVDPKTGDMRAIPDTWERNAIAHVSDKYQLGVVRKLVERIQWCVIAGNVVLHDDWSPYKHYTVVPYFPYFRRGRTIGLVENLLGPQELLNKVSSQELHVVNTSANSGWKVKSGALINMDTAELEQRGAESGIVLEVSDMDGVDKIQPNQTPSGLDRISYKAEEHIKTISGRSDYQTGFAREDVAAKAVRANQAAGSGNTAKILDNLRRTDFLLARNILDMVQEYYGEERLLIITKDRFTGEQEELAINQQTPEGTIANDLTVGEYAVVVTSEPERDTMEDSQFDQTVMMRKEIGVQIPDSVIIQASRLRNKADVVKQMEAMTASPEAQADRELAQRGKAAEVSKLEAEATNSMADAQLKQAKAATEAGQDGSVEAEFEVERYRAEQEIALHNRKLDAELAMKEKELTAKLALQEREFEMKSRLAEQESMAKRAAMAQQPQQQPGAQ